MHFHKCATSPQNLNRESFRFGQGDKPIHAAVTAGHVSAIELMIRQGRGDINTRNGKGETPLIRAIDR